MATMRLEKGVVNSMKYHKPLILLRSNTMNAIQGSPNKPFWAGFDAMHQPFCRTVSAYESDE